MNEDTVTTTTPSQSKLPAIYFVLIGVTILAVILGATFAALKQKDHDQKSTEELVSENSQTSQNETISSPTPTVTPTPSKLNISVLEQGKLVLPNGYADPTLAKTDTGYRMYVNRQSGGPSGLHVYKSADGVTWTKEKDLVIAGVSTSRAVVLPNGVRIYYPMAQPIKPSDPMASMISSFSKDGLSFTKDTGTRLDPRDSGYYVEGPTVFQLPDQTWRMYFNENSVAAGMQRDGEIWGASSSDGLTWTRDQTPTLQSDEVDAVLKQPWKQLLHPFVLPNPNGGYLMFYNSHSEIYAATSNDGLKWEKIGRIGIHGADIDGFFQDDGTLRVFYGDYTPADGGLVYMAVLKIE